MNAIIRLLRSINFWSIVGVIASIISVYLIWSSRRPQLLEFVTTFNEEHVEREDTLLVEYIMVNYDKTDTLIAVSQPFSLLNMENKSAKDLMYNIDIEVINNDSVHYRMKELPTDKYSDNRSSLTQGSYIIEGKIPPRHKWTNPHLLYIRPQITGQLFMLDNFRMIHQYTYFNIDDDTSLKYAVHVMCYPLEYGSIITQWEKDQTHLKKVYRFAVEREKELEDGSIYYKMVDTLVEDIIK